MKNILFTIVLVFVMVFVSNAQSDWFVSNLENIDGFYRTDIDVPVFPVTHGLTENTNLPLGNGLLILGALGAGYAINKKKKE